jgi:hypothetical protein
MTGRPVANPLVLARCPLLLDIYAALLIRFQVIDPSSLECKITPP